MADGPSSDVETKLRRVRYVRHEFHAPASKRENSLLAFIYDVPYLGTCRVFPPLHLLNQILLKGGSTGGMSPGATWEPFSLSDQEYQDLVEAMQCVPPKGLRRKARFAARPFKFDPAFDHYQDYMLWMHEVSEKHREQ